MADLHELSALDQAAAVRRGEVGVVELVEHYLARIERHGDTVGAFVTVTANAALEAARRADARRSGGQDVPPLHGIPIGIKDLNATAGVRTTFGSAVFRDFVPPYDDHIVTRLRDAGTICLGKTNTPEFGLPCYTEPAVAPAARTPWDLDRMAGGSSGGAAAAVAAGLLPFAQASDGGGSIRIPASCCGLVGLKPTRGRVSIGPVQTDITGLPVLGPLARTVRDAAFLLDAMAGPTPGDALWAAPPPESFLAAADREPGRLRIGRYCTPVIADAVLHPDVRAAYDAASSLLAGAGHEIVDIEGPFDPALVPAFETCWSVLSTLTPVPVEAEPVLRPLTRWLRERGRAALATDFAGALVALQQAARRAIEATAAFDAVLTPTLAAPPAVVGALRDDGDPAADFAAQKSFTPFTAAYNMTGQPAMSLPLHWTADDVPIGVQLVGRPGDESTLISLAAQLEAMVGWPTRRPPLWDAAAD